MGTIKLRNPNLFSYDTNSSSLKMVMMQVMFVMMSMVTPLSDSWVSFYPLSKSEKCPLHFSRQKISVYPPNCAEQKPPNLTRKKCSNVKRDYDKKRNHL